MTKKTLRANSCSSVATSISDIDFSDTAKQMAALKAAIFETPYTNHEKIKTLKHKMANDTYAISDTNIAACLLAYEPCMQQNIMEEEFA